LRVCESAIVGWVEGDPEGFCEERVSGKQGEAFTVTDVAGGSSTTFVVVVHAGEVIVDQAVGVDHLHSACGWEHRVIGQVITPTDGFECGKGEERTQPLAPSKERPAHGLMQFSGPPGWRWKEAMQRIVDQSTSLAQPCGEPLLPVVA